MLRRILAALMFLVCTDTAPFAEPVTIRMMTPYPTGTPLARGIEQFATTVNRALEGIARLDLVPPAGEILNIVRSGEVALAAFPSDQYAPSEAGRFTLFELPFVFDDLNQTANVQQSAVGETMLAS